MPSARSRVPVIAAAFALLSVPWWAPADRFVLGIPVWAAASLAVTAAWSLWLAVAMGRDWERRARDDAGARAGADEEHAVRPDAAR